MANVKEQISAERDLQAYRILQSSLNTSQFKRCISNTMKKTSSHNPTEDTTLLIHAIQSFFENRDLENKLPIFMLSEDDGLSILNKIAAVVEYKTATFSKDRRRIENSIQRSTEIRTQLQKSSIENFESHVKCVSDLTNQIERLKSELADKETALQELQDRTKELKKALDHSRKALEGELKKQSVSALSDRMLLLVEELQEQQYKKLIVLGNYESKSQQIAVYH